MTVFSGYSLFLNVQFLFPAFLIAGLSLLVPVLIHLFNLRRYKTVLFPHTRFLKNLQLHSRKQSQLRYKWLLALRLLFLLFLVLAFAQPFFGKKDPVLSGRRLQILYIDNSWSMSVRQGQRSMLDLAKEQARQLLLSREGDFLVLTNDALQAYVPLSRQQALEAVARIGYTPLIRSSAQVISGIRSLLGEDLGGGADLYYITDAQKNSFASRPDTALLRQIRFNGILVRQPEVNNFYIDTAYFELPVLQTGRDNKLVVRSRYQGKADLTVPVIQLSVNGQLKSAVTPSFNQNGQSLDTLSFPVNDAGWQRIVLSTGDHSVHFDDTFLIAARSTAGLSVLVLNGSGSNAYVQAALRSYQGFRVMEKQSVDMPEDISAYNLILLQDISRLEPSLAARLKEALQSGQNVCLFPAANADVASINAGLAQMADIRLAASDTVTQTISSVQSQHSLLKDMFEHIPENVQLPVVHRHYPVQAGLSSGQQSVFSFRNGDPFFASYPVGSGQLYLCASPADLESSNFPGGYFFVPFLYQMASLAKGNDVYAVTSGQSQPIFIQGRPGQTRDRVHIRGGGLDLIPPQRAEGMGVYLFAGSAVQTPGFYTAENQGDSTLIGVNMNRLESDLAVWSAAELQQQWSGRDISWSLAGDGKPLGTGTAGSAFPLWKLCTILALLMLALETILLAGKKNNIITT